MVIFESEFGKTTLFSAKITFYSLLLATKKVLVRNCGCSPRRRVGTRKHTKQIEVTNSGKKVVRTNLYFFINLVVNICLLKNKLAFSN
jgi:hypothetical protein